MRGMNKKQKKSPEREKKSQKIHYNKKINEYLK